MVLSSAVGQFQKVSSAVSTQQTISTSFQVKALILYSVNATAQNVFEEGFNLFMAFQMVQIIDSVAVRASDNVPDSIVDNDTAWQNAVIAFIDATPAITSAAVVSFGVLLILQLLGLQMILQLHLSTISHMADRILQM